MQIIVDIPKEYYEKLQQEDLILDPTIRIFKNGKPLTEQKWIPISEGLPEEDTDVLVCTDEHEIFIADYMGIIGDEPCFDDYNGDMQAGKITWWMPLPKPSYKESEQE